MKKYDVIIVGGGAAGLCLSVLLSRQKGINILLLEALDRVGKKLAVTGNGQCNITNKNLSEAAFHGQDTDFLYDLFSKYGYDFTVSFFKSIGVEITVKENGKAYPYSFQATAVVDALRLTAAEQGVEVLVNTKVTALKKQNDTFLVTAENHSFECKRVVFATGLLAGSVRYGSDASGLDILKSIGLKASNLTPSIVQVCTENSITKQLKGIKLDAKASLKIAEKTARSEIGEVLFTDYGLSGPPILQISRGAFCGKQKGEILLDLMPEYTFNELFLLLKERFCLLKGRKAENFLNGLLQSRVGQVLMKESGFALNDTVGVPSDKIIKQLALKIKGLSFKVTGHNGFVHAQATAGGLFINQFSTKTFECKTVKGLYCIGEILDIDGDCGGYNLQFAWSSAAAAANSILGENK